LADFLLVFHPFHPVLSVVEFCFFISLYLFDHRYAFVY